MNTKVGRPACARRPFIFKATVRRLDWMVVALICLCPVRYLGGATVKSTYILADFWENAYRAVLDKMYDIATFGEKDSHCRYEIRFYSQFYLHFYYCISIPPISNFSYFVGTNETNKGQKKRMLIKFHYYCCIICLDDTRNCSISLHVIMTILFILIAARGMGGEERGRNKAHCLALIVNKCGT